MEYHDITEHPAHTFYVKSNESEQPNDLEISSMQKIFRKVSICYKLLNEKLELSKSGMFWVFTHHFILSLIKIKQYMTLIREISWPKPLPDTKYSYYN